MLLIWLKANNPVKLPLGNKKIKDKIRTLLFKKIKNRYIWDGVIYRSFEDVQKTEYGYNDISISNEMIDTTCYLLQNNISQNKKEIGIREEDYLLSITIATLFNKNKIKILDFGGGLGISFVSLMYSLQSIENIEYYIVENNCICLKGKEILENYSIRNISFSNKIPDSLDDLDIVYICSSLQYVDNYKEILQQLISLNPRYFLFANFSAGNIPTFITAQKNVEKIIIPYRFYNVNEIIEIFKKSGFNIIYKNYLSRYYNQENFPENYRINHTCNLLFVNNNN